MSDTKFREAKDSLKFSSRLMEQMGPQQQMPQQSPEIQHTTPEPVQPPVKETNKAQPEQKGTDVGSIVRGVIDGIKEFFAAKEDEPKEVELKIDATTEPKKEE